MSSQRTSPENGQLKRFYLIRGYVLLVLGAALVIVGVSAPPDPTIFSLGGTLLGLSPVLKSTEAR
jgi:hypothetical protein